MAKEKTIQQILTENDIYRRCLNIASCASESDLMKRSDSTLSLGFKADEGKTDREKEEALRKALMNAFLPNENGDTANAFKRLFHEAVNGKGNEVRKMNALHSSSLCSFLFFFGVRPQHTMTIDGIEYDNVLFEYENRVFSKSRGPSSMDVVLTSSKDNAILFLECKFSEYLINQCQEVAKAYFENQPSKTFYEALDDLYTKCDFDNSYHIRFHDAYSQGIKQIISHLVGLTNFVNGVFYGTQKSRLPNMDSPKVFFREVLFKLEGHEEQFKAYKDLSETVATRLNGKYDSRITWLPLMTYQDIFKQNKAFLPANVKAFYRLQ